MSDEQVKIEFDFEADPQAIGRIENALDNIAKQQERVAKSFAKGNTSLKEATTKQQKLNSAKQELLTVEKQLNAEADRANQKRDEAIEQEKRLVQQSKAGLRAQQDRFDEISRDVSAAGDFQSNLGALRGLSSAAGLGGVSEALDITGESVALIEELPRLAAATAALPNTIKASAAALNAFKTEAIAGLPALMSSVSAGFVAAKASVVSFLAGLGPIGAIALAATVAVGVLTAAFVLFSSSANEAKKVTEEQKKAEELTTAAAKARLVVIQQEQEQLRQLAETRGAQIGSIQEVSEAEGKFSRLTAEARATEGQRIDDLVEKSKELTAEADGLTIAIDNGATAINDIAEAEAALAEQRTQAALEAGSDAAALAKLQQDINKANSEELEKIITTLQERKEVLEAERDALLETGDQSEETLARIEKLNDGIGDVDEQLDRASSSASKAAAAERTLSKERDVASKEAAKVAEKRSKDEEKARVAAAKEAASNQQKAQEKAKQAADKAASEAASRRQKITDIQKKANEDLLNLQANFRKATRDAFVDAKRDELKETRVADKQRKDVLKNLSREEQDLIASGDIFAIKDIREKASDDLADLREDFDFDANERAIQRRNEAGDRLREAIEQRRKLRETAIAQLNDLGQGQRAIRRGWRTMLTGLGDDLSRFTQAITGRTSNVSGRVAPATSTTQSPRVGVNVMVDGAPVRAIVQQEIRALA